MRKIIISAAGMGQRFKQIGLNQPKYSLIANNKTLFYWSMISLKKFFNYEFIFIFRKDNYFEDFIKNELKELGIHNYQIILIDYLTEGQASTVFLADKYINNDDEILIYNIDTHINPDSLNENIFNNDGCIITTQIDGDKWSFAKLGNDNFVKEVSEKIKISDNASVGLYFFKKWSDFKDVYIKHKNDIIKKYKEVYVCPMYQYLIDINKKITIFNIDSKNFIGLGTPEEIQEFDPLWLSYNLQFNK